MSKKLLHFLTFCLLISSYSWAQDTSAYTKQRLKINTLLAERSAKFGQYDESLNKRTGIFGFQTKQDIRNSNEILREIALNDNHIFTELKLLLDYKDLQVQQAQSTSSLSTTSIQNYRRTIKTLQDQTQQLEKKLDQVEKSRDQTYLLTSLFFIATVLLGYLFVQQKRQLKRNEKATI